MARTARQLDGVLLFDKPLRLSSNTALQKVRKLFQAAKAGHTGTLDPLATGLLPICFGEATKFSNALLDADKTYRAIVKLGQTSSTGDAEGEITVIDAALPDEDRVLAVLRNFIGEIEQIPPMHSAIKHQGKPLYEHIRKGGSNVERKPRLVTIHELVLENFAGSEFDMTVRCSKGTYIRTLAEDIGQALGCGAHLIGLRRTAIAQFRLESAYTWEQLEEMDMQRRESRLLPVDCMLQQIPGIELDATQARRIAQGQSLVVDAALPDGRVRLYSEGKFLGAGMLEAGRKLVAERLISRVAMDAAIAAEG
jgi:tRNA pseudouridine55 synthase